ncbi:ABC transporter ATP-binding protein [Pseudothermotoga sp.]|nr:ABC transporter ATP-binding protein [Pseudothermotoga sp.]MCX7812414.1 ABC transporter ATP-binding protein [Pseudothermotoga sp.]MDW8140132.1 ABC transporter ATP-binding protein [Pseudothermotoga sp.]
MLLKVEKLKVGFKTNFGRIIPVDDVSFEMSTGEVVGLVGESGCGKTVTAYSIVRLLPKNAFIDTESHVWFGGIDLISLSEEELYKVRGKDIAMIFQEPMTSLNPVFTVGWQIQEVYELHERLEREEAELKTIDMLKKVKIPEPERRFKHYPHQFSGGMRQRVMIAMALACRPKLLIADEPTTALDVTIQAQILKLMLELKKHFGTSILLITHNLAVVAEMCDKVVVMYAGQVIEKSNVFDLFENPLHPYTKALLRAIPKIDQPGRSKLISIEGVVPHPMRYPKGCRFHPRCSEKLPICSQEPPRRIAVNPDHEVKCWLYDVGGK